MTCPAGAGNGATCFHLDVDCSNATGVPSLGATVAIIDPTTTLKGTVFLHGGGAGTNFSNGGALTTLGFRTVAVKWDSEWEATTGEGILRAACRPVTVMKWAFDVPHMGSRTDAFCAQGFSAGSGVISYALAHYGMGDYLDYANLISGPPFGRIDYGCASNTYDGGPITVCGGQPGQLNNAPLAYSGPGPQGLINSGEGTTTCATPDAGQADIDHWKADSIVSPGAVYDYPQTVMKFFYCTSASTNEVTGLGSFFYGHITSSKSEACYTNCSGEGVTQDDAGAADISMSMVTNCVPRH
jgi:hypothetical protein